MLAMSVCADTAFVNADLIAAVLSPLAPEQQLFTASRLFLQQIENHITAAQPARCICRYG
jgi:predicted ABC-type ATPase